MEQLNIPLRSGNLTVALLSNGAIAILPEQRIKTYVEYVKPNLQCLFDKEGVTFVLDVPVEPLANKPTEEYNYNSAIMEYKEKPLLLMWLKSLSLGE